MEKNNQNRSHDKSLQEVFGFDYDDDSSLLAKASLKSWECLN